ncbi:hypothetical protein NCCP133_02240 [Cytobacillus sp. NCCP-133]|nr:hypothetical protein NCCP133_02240 [Cytobacillus sp. NCCP-133]
MLCFKFIAVRIKNQLIGRENPFWKHDKYTCVKIQHIQVGGSLKHGNNSDGKGSRKVIRADSWERWIFKAEI